MPLRTGKYARIAAIMKTYKLFDKSSTAFDAIHTFKEASFSIEDGVYVFYDEAMNKLHAIAVSPGLFVKTSE